MRSTALMRHTAWLSERALPTEAGVPYTSTSVRARTAFVRAASMLRLVMVALLSLRDSKLLAYVNDLRGCCRSPGARIYVTTDGQSFNLVHTEATTNEDSLMAANMLSQTEIWVGGTTKVVECVVY